MTGSMIADQGCICSNKDKNFKANHNTYRWRKLVCVVVSVVTKIRILKQITTLTVTQPYHFRCICSNKDKNFKANHNFIVNNCNAFIVVSVATKIRILKQITTSRSLNTAKRKLRL